MEVRNGVVTSSELQDLNVTGTITVDTGEVKTVGQYSQSSRTLDAVTSVKEGIITLDIDDPNDAGYNGQIQIQVSSASPIIHFEQQAGSIDYYSDFTANKVYLKDRNETSDQGVINISTDINALDSNSNVVPIFMSLGEHFVENTSNYRIPVNIAGQLRYIVTQPE